MDARPVLRRLGQARPDFLALHAREPERFPFLFESAAEGPHGRWDVLAESDGERLVLRADGGLECPSGVAARAGFLATLDAWVADAPAVGLPAGDAAGHPAGQAAAHPMDPGTRASEARLAGAADHPPFTGGWCLYLGYELAAEVEPRLRLPPSRGLVACAERTSVAALYDRWCGELWVAGEAGTEERLGRLESLLAAAPRAPGEAWHASGAVPVAEDPPDRYLAAVARALEHIAAGDVYQANLARAWRGRVPPGTPVAQLYARLRAANPGPFAALAQLPDAAVLSTSPERLVRCRGGRVETRPIAGTRPRVGDDAATVAELHAHPKERAEHVMLVDLERNDLGRIALPGSVVVDEFMVVESYAHVHHIVSNVRGDLRPGTTAGEVIRAVFPGGTITGCPKVRCMEIVAALEGEARGAYTGSLGYLGRDGTLDLNILIRTATVDREGRLELRAGAGIVADSEPERELEETRAKARGLLRGLAGPHARGPGSSAPGS